MTGKFRAALFVILVDICGSLNSDFHLTVGPKSSEKGIYIYTKNTPDFKYCLYCPDGAFDNTEANKLTQEPECIDKYDNISEEIKPHERENNKIPICKVGEIPGCGPPPEEKKAGYIWSCDPVFSNTIYSVYTSCALISKQTQALTWSYYCNEDLKWELDVYNNESHPVQAEESSNSFALKLVLIVTGIIFTILVACLLVCVVMMCRKRNHRDRNYVSRDDPEARSTFISSSSTGNNTHMHDTENIKQSSHNGSFDSGIAESNEDKQKKETAVTERHPPYGEERSHGNKGNFGGNTCSEDKHPHESQSLFHKQSTDGRVISHPQSDNSVGRNERSRAFLNGIGTGDLQKPVDGQVQSADVVRAEFQQPFSSYIRRQHTSNPDLTTNNQLSLNTSHLPQMKELDETDSVDVISTVRGSFVRPQLEETQVNIRPDPTGNNSTYLNNLNEIRGFVPLHSYTESGYFDDENDKRHNTRRKQVVESESGKLT